MFYRLLLPRVLKFHAFRHADYVINCLILKDIFDLFHGEIAMLLTPFLPKISANGEDIKASATEKNHFRENGKSYQPKAKARNTERTEINNHCGELCRRARFCETSSESGNKKGRAQAACVMWR